MFPAEEGLLGGDPVRKFLCLCLSIKLRLMSQRTDEKFKSEDARRELRTASVMSIA